MNKLDDAEAILNEISHGVSRHYRLDDFTAHVKSEIESPLKVQCVLAPLLGRLNRKLYSTRRVGVYSSALFILDASYLRQLIDLHMESPV